MNSLISTSKPVFFLISLLLALCTPPALLEAAEVEPAKLHTGQPGLDIIKGINHLYDLEFDEGETVFDKMVSERPEYPAGYFYRSMVTWSRLAVGFWSPQNLKEYVERIDQTISVAKNRINKDPKDCQSYF